MVLAENLQQVSASYAPNRPMNPDVVVDRMERPGAGTRKVCGSSLSHDLRGAIGFLCKGLHSDPFGF